MQHTVRPATVQDARVLADLRLRMFQEIDPEDEIEPGLTDVFTDYFIQAIPAGVYVAFVAEDNGRVVGTAGTAIVSVPPLPGAVDGRVARIQSVYVLPESRRRGIARALLAETIEAIRRLGIHRVALMATDDGRTLYEEFGFRISQEMILDLAEEAPG